MSNAKAGERRPIRLIVAMPKGGSGKTTTAIALAWGFKRLGWRVLLVDLDPQGNATAALGRRAGTGYGTRELLFGSGRAFAPVEVGDRFDLVPASGWHEGVETAVQEASRVAGPVVVARALGRVELGYDLVICDCSPSLGPGTYNALAAGPVLAPVEMTRLAVSVVPDLDRVVSALRKSVAPAARILGYLPTRYRSHVAESHAALRALLSFEGPRVLRARVPLATDLARCVAEGRSPFDAAYRKSKGPAAYLEVVEEVRSLLEEHHG